MKLIWIISKQFRVTKVNIGQGGRDLYLSIFLETRRVLLPPHHLQSDKDDVEAREEGSYLKHLEFLNILFLLQLEVWEIEVTYYSLMNKNVMFITEYNT